MSLFIIKCKPTVFLVLFLVITLLPAMTYAQDNNIVILNSSFRMHKLSDYALKNVNQKVYNFKQFNGTLGADYNFSSNNFFGIQLSFERVIIEFDSEQHELHFAGVGITGGKKFVISSKFLINSRLIIMYEDGMEKQHNPKEFYRGGIYSYSNYTKLIRMQVSLSPELVYTPTKKTGIFLRIMGLNFNKIKEDENSNVHSFNFDVHPLNSSLGFSYSI